MSGAMLSLFLYAIQTCTWSTETFPYMQRRHAHAERDTRQLNTAGV